MLRKVEIENFMCLKDVDVAFHPRLNVFTGENGSGKSAMLNAIEHPMRFAGGDWRGFELMKGGRILDDSISEGMSESNITLECLIRNETRIIRASSNPDKIFSDIERERCLLDYRIYLPDAWSGQMPHVTNQARKLVRAIAGFDFMFDDDENMRKVVRTEIDGTQTSSHPLSRGEGNLVYAMLSATLQSCISCENLYDEDLSCNDIESVIICYGNLEDRIHPDIQKKIIPVLLDFFPKSQFFITTNSPHLFSNVCSESLFMLKKTDGRSACVHLDDKSILREF